MNETLAGIKALTERNREIFRLLVEAYLETGDPIGSRTLSRQIENTLSPASVRNIMQDLEVMGLLSSPHVSSGRIPTEHGLRLFIDGLLQIRDLPAESRAAIDRALGPEFNPEQHALKDMLDEASTMLSELSQCAAFVIAPKHEARIQHVEVANLSAGRSLMILVGEDGSVENRLLTAPTGLTASAITEATNFLNAHLRGLKLSEARKALDTAWQAAKIELNALAQKLIANGFAEWSENSEHDTLVLRGLSKLLDDVDAAKDLDRLKHLFDDLERHENMGRLIHMAQDAEGVRVFIGSENQLYSFADSSIVISSCKASDHAFMGAIGVIGPKRLNYARIVPIVDYTARLVGRIAGDFSSNRF